MRFKSLLFITSLFFFAHVAANNNFSIKTVVIDAGHGGKDPGASGPGKTNEKDIALAVALKLGEQISKNFPDVNVIYTRKTDIFLELHERAEIANKAKADLFIAVHINSSTNSEVYGTSSYVLGLHRTEANLEVAKRENAVILMEDDRDKNYEFDPNSPEGHIVMSMKQNAFLDQSIDLASKAENQLETYAKRKSLGVKQAGFYVLYKTTMPSLLAEIGFISNPEEEMFLKSVKGQDQIAVGLFNAFKDYKIEMEGGLGEKIAAEQKAEQAEAAVTKAETKTETPEVKKEVEEVKADATPSSDYVITKSGKNIRKPIENANGGGKAVTAVAEPVKKPEPVVKKEEPKPVAEIKTEPKPIEKTEPVVKKEEPKPIIKEEVETEIKPKPVVVEKKEEPKPVVVEKKAEPKPVVVEKKTEPKPIAVEAKAESGVTFKVQLFALKGDVKANEYNKAEKLFTPISTETLSNGYTRYYGGNVTSYTAVKKILATAKSSGYPDAYIVGFKDGSRMNGEQMKAFEK